MRIDDVSKEQLVKKIKALDRELSRFKDGDAKHIFTEGALIKSEAKAQAFMNATSDLAVLLNTKCVILEVNEAAIRRFDKNVTDVVGKNLFDLFPPEFKEFKRVYVDIVLQTKEPHSFQEEYKGRTFQVCIHPILNNDDEVERLAVFVSDYTKYRRNEELLYRYSQIFSTVQDPMCYIDRNYIFRTVNDAYLNIYKKSGKEIVGHPVAELLGKEFFEEKIKKNFKRCLKGQKVQQQEWFDFPDSSRRFMYMSYYPLFSKDNKSVTGVVLNSTDITKIKEMEEKLKLLSVTDPLTQIYNRMKFNETLTEEIKRVKRYKTPLSMIMLDIDHFKEINDTHGHDVGDKILVSLVNQVKNFIRETDIFSRWGGEEFMILLPLTTLEHAAILAERIRLEVMRHKFAVIGSLTCSFGVSEFLADDSVETFTKRVDNALYESKRNGKNRMTFM